MRCFTVLVICFGLLSSAVAAELLDVSGKVIDALTSEPLPGINIVASGQGRPLANATTDAEGKFRFSAPAGGPLTIILPSSTADYLLDDRYSGTSYSVQKLTTARSGITFKVHLRKLSPLRGNVVDPEGKPVAGMRVSLGPRLPASITAADGTFTFAKAPTDRPGVVMAFNEALGGQADYKVNQSELTIRVLARQERDCIVTTDDGAPVPDLRLEFSATDMMGRQYPLPAVFAFLAGTDSNGRCRIIVIPGFSYSLSWPAGPVGPGGRTVVCPNTNAAEPIRVTIPQFNKTLTLHFTDSAGSPLPDVQVQLAGSSNLVAPRSLGQYNQMKSDAHGTLQIKGLAKGVLRFSAFVQQGNYRQSTYAVSTDAGEAAFALRTRQQPAQYTVRVVDSTGQGVPAAQVSLFTRTGEGPADQEDFTTDGSGTVTVTISAEATAGLLCDDPDRGWGGLDVNTNQDGALELPLRIPETPLQLEFVDAQRNPVTGAKVKVISLRAQLNNSFGPQDMLPQRLDDEVLTHYGLMRVTGADGRVAFPRIDSARAWTISVESPEFGLQSKRLPETGRPHVIELLKLASLSGRLSFKNGANLDPSRIELLLIQEGATQTVDVSPDGSFQAPPLEPGDYTLGAQSLDPAVQKYTLPPIRLRLASGEQRTMELLMETGIPLRGKFDGMVDGRRPKLRVYAGRREFAPIQVRDDGTFELWVGEPGSYQLWYELRPDIYRPLPEPIDVNDKNPVEGIEIKLP